MNFIAFLFALGSLLFFSLALLSVSEEILFSSKVFFAGLSNAAASAKCFLVVDYYYSSGGGFFSDNPGCDSVSGENYSELIFSEPGFLDSGSHSFVVVASDAHYR